jgi:hypothetical protein
LGEPLDRGPEGGYIIRVVKGTTLMSKPQTIKEIFELSPNDFKEFVTTYGTKVSSYVTENDIHDEYIYQYFMGDHQDVMVGLTDEMKLKLMNDIDMSEQQFIYDDEDELWMNEDFKQFLSTQGLTIEEFNEMDLDEVDDSFKLNFFDYLVALSQGEGGQWYYDIVYLMCSINPSLDYEWDVHCINHINQSWLGEQPDLFENIYKEN